MKQYLIELFDNLLWKLCLVRRSQALHTQSEMKAALDWNGTLQRKLAALQEQYRQSSQTCGLHVEEIKRLEAVRDEMWIALEQEQSSQIKRNHDRYLQRSEVSKRGWQKRKAKKLEVAA